VTAQEVIFNNGPYHDLVASENLTIVESGDNYAILTGTGTLTGQAYTHQTNIVPRRMTLTRESTI
jgi:hypothetical protein